MAQVEVQQQGPGEYLVKTDLPPEMVSRVGLEIFKLWMDFAMGLTALGGRRIIHPTGRYASAIQFKQEGEATVAIVANESVAKEAAILETGHGAVDLKTKLRPGRYKMHRTPGAVPGSPLRRTGTAGPPSMRPSIWASLRAGEQSGYATLSPNSPAGSWIIPVMPAYSPAMVLANMIQSEARKLGG